MFGIFFWEMSKADFKFHSLSNEQDDANLEHRLKRSLIEGEVKTNGNTSGKVTIACSRVSTSLTPSSSSVSVRGKNSLGSGYVRHQCKQHCISAPLPTLFPK